MTKYKAEWEQRYDGDWQPVCRVEFVACCHCGLVHKIETRFRKVGKNKVPRLHSRWSQDNRRTAAIRRHKGVKVVAVGKKKS